MKPSNSARSKAREMTSSRCSPVGKIPREIWEQEEEIESIFWDLVRLNPTTRLHRSPGRTDNTWKRHVGAWIAVAAYLIITILPFYLLWLKFID